MTAEVGLPAAQRVHLIGIGGSGMSALATLLLKMGKHVSGSDVARSPVLDELRQSGATIFDQHTTPNVANADYVVRSSAVASDNPEVVEAIRLGLPNKKLAEAVAELVRHRSVVAVSGTHGKTTTSALVAWLLDQGGLEPLALIGADIPAYPHGARLGDGPVVIEADEYDRRFLNYWPEVAVVTSIEADHLDYFRDLSEIRDAFADLVGRLPPHGYLIACADEPCAASLDSTARRETYGFSSGADWRIEDYAAVSDGGSCFTLRTAGRAWHVQSPLVGEHNARNVAAAIAVADHYGVGLQASLAAVASFQGPRRRFETRGRPRGVWVVDDYGHHPTEVVAVLRAASSAAKREVWVVFQPHTTNRTAALLDQFATSFGEAHHAVILPIYRPSGRETAAHPIASEHLVERIRGAGHPDVRLAHSFEEAQRMVIEGAQSGDLVITMGAGDVTVLSDRLVEALTA